MAGNAAQYEARRQRYLTAMDLGKPDKVPIRLALGEVQAVMAGCTLQEVYYRQEANVAAAGRVAERLDIDVVAAPSRWWASLHDAVGARYLRWAGKDLDVDTQMQFVEGEYMTADDYDAFTEDPTRWLLQTYLPRIHADFAEPGSYRANLALIKGSAAYVTMGNIMRQATVEWREKYGMPVGYSGFGKAPFDTLGDTLRGMRGVLTDIHRRPAKLLAAMQAVVPHNVYYAMASAGGDTVLPAFMPLHRGSLPFLSPKQWDTYYWPSLKAVLEGLWAQGKRTVFYAEGNWTPYLDRIAALPEKSIVFHVDQTEFAEVRKHLAGRFCISGGVPNALMAYGSRAEVSDHCKKLIDENARDGGFIIDTGAAMQTDARVENIETLVETVREYGTY